jgi:hypothetical protein
LSFYLQNFPCYLHNFPCYLHNSAHKKGSQLRQSEKEY